MATFTTEQATNYLRECLARPKNPTPFLIVEYAHKTQRFEEIETRLQGHFGFHDHAPSLRIIARDAVCNIVLERKRAEQVAADISHWAASIHYSDRADVEIAPYDVILRDKKSPAIRFAAFSHYSDARRFADMNARKLDFDCGDRDGKAAESPTLNRCNKCGKDATEPLIAVDEEDFDVRYWNGDEWVAHPAKTVKRFLCSGCCRG